MKHTGMTTDQLINKCFWIMITVMVGWGMRRIDRLADSVDMLNRNMAVAIAQIANHEHSITSLYEFEFDKRAFKEKRNNKED